MLKATSKLVMVTLFLSLVGCTDDIQVLERLSSVKATQGSVSTNTFPEPALDDQVGQYQLAHKYLEQDDVAAAMKWISVCANAGHQPCVKELGYAYLQGAGVEQDPYLGVALLEESLDTKDPSMLNDLAWYFATSDVPEIRNPDKAMELMTLLKKEHGLDAMTADTMAAVQAAQGLYGEAAKTQKLALNMLLRQGKMGYNILSGYRSRLQLYRSEQAYRD